MCIIFLYKEECLKQYCLELLMDFKGNKIKFLLYFGTKTKHIILENSKAVKEK